MSKSPTDAREIVLKKGKHKTHSEPIRIRTRTKPTNQQTNKPTQPARALRVVRSPALAKVPRQRIVYVSPAPTTPQKSASDRDRVFRSAQARPPSAFGAAQARLSISISITITINIGISINNQY
ncbi:hypothetical protein D9615_005805 [Tricholomella constricta]|uniref:Uncharacterized protein n=1 Tax=Tricholomella constricta TaxID=117010 RepID=A0A8H5HAC7_9AGAR|nr:hypothetical protein D9615_005805 [Tricholomella constricta]